MPVQRRHKTEYPGVYYIMGKKSTEETAEKIYYIRYRHGGKLVEERVGRQYQDKMTPARAARVRSKRMEEAKLVIPDLGGLEEKRGVLGHELTSSEQVRDIFKVLLRYGKRGRGEHPDARHIKAVADAFIRDVRFMEYALDRAADTAFWMKEGHPHFIYVNQRACEKLGYTKEQFLSMGPSGIDPLYPKDRVEENLKMIRSLGEMTFESVHRASDGTEFDVEISAYHLEFEGDHYYIHFARDITERKNAERQIEGQREYLKLMNKILRHDILNSLSAIKSALRLYERKHERGYIDEVMRRIEQSMTLIDRMRMLERLREEKREMVSRDFGEILRYIKKVYPDVALHATGHHVVVADEALEAVFENIISNAYLHGEASQVDLRLLGESDHVVIQIADDGKGIPAEAMESIFNEGFSFGKRAGSGLGLHIVRKAIASYGGTVTVTGNKPKGTVFTVRLPRKR